MTWDHWWVHALLGIPLGLLLAAASAQWLEPRIPWWPTLPQRCPHPHLPPAGDRTAPGCPICHWATSHAPGCPQRHLDTPGETGRLPPRPQPRYTPGGSPEGTYAQAGDRTAPWTPEEGPGTPPPHTTTTEDPHSQCHPGHCLPYQEGRATDPCPSSR